MDDGMSNLCEIQWDFDGEDEDWKWLNENATFSHREACEFIVHVGEDDKDATGLTEYARDTAAKMGEAGCSDDFIAEYVKAAQLGAVRVLFYA